MTAYEQISTPLKIAAHYYYSAINKEHERRVMYQQDGLEDFANRRLFLNVNEMWPNQCATYRRGIFSNEKIFAYMIGINGSDRWTIKFRTVPDGKDLPDEITNVYGNNITWMRNNEGVFYCKFDGNYSYAKRFDKLQGHSVYYHKLGTNSTDDVRICNFPQDPHCYLSSKLKKGELIVYVNWIDRSMQSFTCNLKQAENMVTNSMEFLPKNDDEDEDEKNRKKLPSSPKRIVQDVYTVDRNKLLVHYFEDAKSVVCIHEKETGRELYQFPLGFGHLTAVQTDTNESEFFLQFESFLKPEITYRGDFKDCSSLDDPVALTVYHKSITDDAVVNELAEHCVEKQVFYNSKDGKKIPMFLVHSKALKLNGRNPTILHAYGGFSSSELPYFSPENLVLLRNFDVVLAFANIRGGGEYGNEWHLDGKLDKKQNCFDDLHAAAEYLIENGYTSNKKLAISGGSNGGLLVATAAQQRPDLYGAVVCEVPLLDMLRFNQFTIGYRWMKEYGSPNVPAEFDTLFSYSPLHNISPLSHPKQWPAMLLTTSDHDDRVPPFHALKYSATLHQMVREAMPWQRSPLLVRIEKEAGHNMCWYPRKKKVNQLTDIISFLQLVLGMHWRSGFLMEVVSRT